MSPDSKMGTRANNGKSILRKILLLDVHVCPWWLAYAFDNPVRLLFHDPKKMLGPYVREGMTVIDVGCGMGYFSLGMTHLVGDKGTVIAVDLQQAMIDALERRAGRAGVLHRIQRYRCEPDRISIDRDVDFALTFWMVHEVPGKKAFFKQIFSMLKPGGKLLLVEPRVHVSDARFKETVAASVQTGLRILDTPRISLSRAALLVKP